MGLLDDMAKEIRDEAERPDGFMSVAEFAEASGMTLAGASAKLRRMHASGELSCRSWKPADAPKRCMIYGPPCQM